LAPSLWLLALSSRPLHQDNQGKSMQIRVISDRVLNFGDFGNLGILGNLWI